MTKAKKKVPPVLLGPTEVANRPELAIKIAAIIAGWAYLEELLGAILGNLMRAEPRTTIILLERFYTTNQRTQAVRKIAEDRLPSHELEMFKKDLKTFDRIAKERNKISHGLWGTSVDHPSELIYITPNDKDAWERLFLKRVVSGQVDDPSDIPWPDWEFYDAERFQKIESDITVLISALVAWKAKTTNSLGRSS